jgi:hypothetical protein
MEIKVNWVLYTLIALIMLTLGWYFYKCYCKKDTFNDTINDTGGNIPINLNDPKCICVFDIDHTISCGDPKPYVDSCIRHGCKIALNTARPVKYVGDVDIAKMGIVDPYYSEDDFYYNPNSYSQTAIQVAEVKSGFLELLKNKYTIKDKSCVILLDDNKHNINIANSNDFGTVKASRSRDNCGLSKTDLEIFETKLLNCNQDDN